MQYKEFSEEVYNILRVKAVNQAKRYYHTFIGTAHLFLATFAFLSSNKDDARYGVVYNDLKAILNKYGVDGKKFEEVFLQYCPKGNAPEDGEKFSISVDREYTAVIESLRRNAVKNGRSMEVEDLVFELFSDKSFMIYTIFTDVIGDDNKTEAMYAEISQKFRTKVATKIKELEELSELLNLNSWVSENPQTVIDATDPIMKIEMALSGRSIRNCLLTGPAGCGKSTYVYELAQRINTGNVPEQFKDKIIYELSSDKLVAGTKYRGDMEQKITNIMDVVAKNPNVIIFIDELHNFLSLGATGDDASGGAGNLIKPYMTKGQVQIIGCTTAEEYTKYILPDKAFASRFHEVKIDEPTKEATTKILEGILPVETEYFKKDIQRQLVSKVIELSDKYSLDQANPRKAINMLELACAYCKVFEEQKQTVDVEDVINSVRLRYNIYISKNKLEDTRKGLFGYLLGQDAALNQVLRNLQVVDAEITDPERPCLSMLLCGPTGTGKTETCKIIAKNFYGSEDNLVKVAMGEYSTEQDVSKISGSAPGLVGYEDEPQLIKDVRQHPNSVILFDEIEKAHPSVQKVLLNILDTGEMRDNKGNRISFRNNIIIFTTNLGCTHDSGKAVGMGLVKSTIGSGKNDIMKAIKGYFSPEFLGRLDDIVYYDSLSKDVLTQLANRYIAEYKLRSTRDIIKNMIFTEEDMEEIFKEAHVETQGARGVRKSVQKKIASMYAKLLEEHNAAEMATDF